MITKGVFNIICCLFIVWQSMAQQTVGIFLNEPESFEGYTLFHPNSSQTTYLLDNCGRKVHEWPGVSRPGLGVYLLADGNLLRSLNLPSTIFTGGGVGGAVQLLSWEGDIIWQGVFASPTFHQHHDIEPLPNGNFLVLTWDLKSREQAIQAGRDSSQIGDGIWSEKILEVTMIGTNEYEVVWEWDIWDHLIQDFDESKDNFGIVSDHPELLNINYNSGFNPDWLHCNSIAYNEDFDQIILSSRNLNEVFIIDHSTTTSEAASGQGGNAGKGGDLLYRWGNPVNYGRGDEDDQKLFGQHDAKWIPADSPDGGKVMVFNNGTNRIPNFNYSSVDIIDLPFDETTNTYSIDEENSFAPADVFWRYVGDPLESFYSANISGASRLANGNTLVCEGREGRFFEINSDKEIVWEYINPVSSGIPVSQGDVPGQNSVFRAERYAADYSAFIGRDLNEGEPIEVGELPIACTLVSIDELEGNENFVIYPNPASDVIHLEWEGNGNKTLHIYDALGQLISTNHILSGASIPLENFEKGIYFILENGKALGRFVIQR